MQCWIYAFTYFGIPRMYCKKPSWSGFNLHAWCQFNYISSWFGHLADTNLNFHKCKTHCAKKSRQPWFIRYVIWKKCTSSRFFIQKLTFIQKTAKNEHLSKNWSKIYARHTVQRKADNLDSSDTWSGKNAQVVVDNGSFETGNYLKQQLRIRFVPFLYRRGPSEDISCFDKNRSIKKKK